MGYIDDEMSKQNHSMLPRYRQKHIEPSLDLCDSYFEPTTKDKNHHSQSDLYFAGNLNKKSKHRRRPHLFRLYPVLCKLIRVKDEEIKNLLCDVFKTFGDEMGLSNNNNKQSNDEND